MKDKFKNVPIEEDTKLLFSNEFKFDGRDVLYQMWSWDGIQGESLIFLTEDVKDLTEDQIKEMVKESPLVKKKDSITYSQGDSGYTFLNFNFEYS